MTIVDFKKNLPTVNEFIYFDENAYLREKTTNPLKLNQVICNAADLLKHSDEEDKYFLYGVMGNLYRTTEQPRKAIECLTYCLNYAVKERKTLRNIVSLIRLGEAHKYNNNHKEALVHFDKAQSMCEANKIEAYLDFALQHKGKCLMELARLKEAEDCFSKALQIRKLKDEASLIDSTQQALDLVIKLKAKKKNCKGE